MGGNPVDNGKSGYADIRIDGCDLHDNEFYGALVTGCWHHEPVRYANTGSSSPIVGSTITRVIPGTAKSTPAAESWSKTPTAGSSNGVPRGKTAPFAIERLADLLESGPPGSRRITIQHCEAFRNRTGTSPDGDGFDLDGGSIECVIQYNYSHDNDGAGILVYRYPYAPLQDRDNVVRYNVSENDAVKLGHYGAIYVGNDDHGMSGVQVYNNTFIAGPSAKSVISLHGKDVGVAFRNNLILAPTGCPLVANDNDSDAIIFQGNLYWAAGGRFKTTGAKDCDSLEAWRKAGKEMIGAKAVGFFADPKLDLAAPIGQTNDPALHLKLSRFRPPSQSPAIDCGDRPRGSFKLDPGGQDILGTRIPVGTVPMSVRSKPRAGREEALTRAGSR